MKSYRIITPIQFDPAKPAKKSGIVELEAEIGDEMVKLDALAAIVDDAGDDADEDDGEEQSVGQLAEEMLGKMTLKQLTDLAVKAEVVLAEKATKAQIIEALKAKRDAENAAADAEETQE